MSNIYTKTGDKGYSSLVDGTRVPKDDILLESYGTIDELNAHIALFLAMETDFLLQNVQHQLFVVGGMLATPPKKWNIPDQINKITDYITSLESAIDQMSASLSPLQKFILPGGSQAIAQLHVCRTVCRRAERRIAQLAHRDECYFPILIFANRLSDFLFILARFYHKKLNIHETYWESTT
jgi:cob(I)alamin adenosyltransferase